MRYGTYGLLETRLAATRAVVQRLQHPCIDTKPFYFAETNPFRALRRCTEWAHWSGVPCDGAIFALRASLCTGTRARDAMRPGYNTASRLWKLKDCPTVDFAVYRAYASSAPASTTPLYELMLRGAPGTLQSLHRFRDSTSGAEYRLPVLLQPPVDDGLKDGDVVEVSLRPDSTGAVRYPTMQIRERGKRPNYLIGCMDLVANGLSVGRLLRTECPLLCRLLIRGPLRRNRARFLSAALQRSGAQHVLDVGGGCGGDAPFWATHPAVRTVHVVEPDCEAVREYQRRLHTSFAAVHDPGDGAWRLPGGTVFYFQTTDLQGATPRAPPAGPVLAALCYSISQIVADHADPGAVPGGHGARRPE